MKRLLIFLFFITFNTQNLKAQVQVFGKIIDKKTGTELEGVKVIIKKKNVYGGGYFAGIFTEDNGSFDVATNFRYPLELVVSKIGCTNIKIPLEKKKNYYTIELECEKEFIEKIIIEKKSKTFPLANPDYVTFSTQKNTIIYTDSLLVNDSDPEGDDLSITILDKPIYGDILYNSDGFYEYRPNINVEYLMDSLSYIVSDGYQTDTSYIILNRSLTFPEANPDIIIFTRNENVLVYEDSILINDSYPQNYDPQIKILKYPTNGELLYNNDGFYEYRPSNKVEYISDTLIYSLYDKYTSDTSYVVFNKLEVGTDLATIIEINPIYFDLNKSEIRDDAAKELDKIIEIMKEYPKMIIELGSHTDCLGNDNYNIELSEKRAKLSARYIQRRIDGIKDYRELHSAIVKNFNTKISYKSFYIRMNSIKYRKQIFNYIGDKAEAILGYKTFEDFEDYINSDELMQTYDDRIKGKGYGESKPKVICDSGCSSCSESHHQLNRRTEFIIVDIGQK